MHHPVYRALVTYSNSTTGEIRVKIPSLLGIDSEVSISYIGRSIKGTTWVVPSVDTQIVVTADDENLTNIFWVQVDASNSTTSTSVTTTLDPMNDSKFSAIILMDVGV